jgi:3',5'-cyclic-AMP phosphodiesterase
MTTLIAHLSDPHITTGPLGGRPAEGLRAALARAAGLDPRPDAVVVTGDLTDHGRPDEYEALREVIGEVPIPVHLALGNHDDREAMLDAFAGGPLLNSSMDAHYAVEYPEATVVVLDSYLPGSPAGRLGAAQLDWLADVLARRPDAPALLGLHHPPVPVGIELLDGMRLQDGDALLELVRANPRVVRVMAGHVHRTITAGVVTVAPSTYRQTGLELRPGRTPGYLDEPTGFLLHRVGADGCVTHLVPVSHAGARLAAY